jgi:hypothetical protein
MNGEDTIIFKNKFGFKKVTLRSWQEPDITTLITGSWAIGHQDKTLAVEGWFKVISEPQLDETVSNEVASIYEYARSILYYGILFYPFFTIGKDHALRAAEAAAYFKCEALNLPKRRHAKSGQGREFSFSENINRLHEVSVISAEHVKFWHSVRRLRNSSSHPKNHSHIMPQQALQLFKNIADNINRLFQ